MVRTIHLGYSCNSCHERVPVYTFSRSSNSRSSQCTPPVDRSVECPKCHAARHISFAELQTLERWEEYIASEGNAA